MPSPCLCKAYPFPHRVNGGECKETEPYDPLDIPDLERMLDDRDRARDMNAELDKGIWG